jgi:hypothetical protein
MIVVAAVGGGLLVAVTAATPQTRAWLVWTVIVRAAVLWLAAAAEGARRAW